MKRFIQATPFLPIRPWLLLPLLAQLCEPLLISMNCFGLRVMLSYIGSACEPTGAMLSLSQAKISVGTVTAPKRVEPFHGACGAAALSEGRASAEISEPPPPIDQPITPMRVVST